MIKKMRPKSGHTPGQRMFWDLCRCVIELRREQDRKTLHYYDTIGEYIERLADDSGGDISEYQLEQFVYEVPTMTMQKAHLAMQIHEAWSAEELDRLVDSGIELEDIRQLVRLNDEPSVRDQLTAEGIAKGWPSSRLAKEVRAHL